MREQKKAYDFMVSFRETFSRPVRRIVSSSILNGGTKHADLG